LTRPLLQIIVGSTRPGRAGAPVAEWFEREADKHGGFDLELVDLAKVDLPMFDEPVHPMRGEYVGQHTLDWSATVERADSFVFITPEYNGGYPAALKNALDYLNAEWRYKAVGFVSYGGVAAGKLAVGQLKQVVTTLRMFPVANGVHIPFIGEKLVDGTIEANEIMAAGVTAMLDELLLIGSPLATLRS